jgi:hypothetical protein
MNQPDDELRGRFRSLRDDERAGAPPFRETWDAASRRMPVAARWRVTPVLTLAAAAGVVLAAGLVLRSVRDRDSARLLADSTVHAPDVVPSITTWTSPTAGLLRSSGSELLAAPPALHASILDRVVPAPVQPRGNTP